MSIFDGSVLRVCSECGRKVLGDDAAPILGTEPMEWMCLECGELILSLVDEVDDK